MLDSPDADKGEPKKVVVAELPAQRRPPRCGLCGWRPDCLQVGYKWQLGLALMCWFGLLQGFIVHGIMAVDSSALERRFKLTSIQVGWFNSVLELSAAASTIVFSYLADRGSRPRWLMISAWLFTIGCILMSIPHYIADPYDGNGKGESDVCQIGSLSNATRQHRLTIDSDECSGVKASSWLNLLIAGSVITGIGAGIIFTVGVAFVEDFSSHSSSPLNIGIMYMFTAGGAAAGFAGGSGLLQLDVNINRPDWPQFKGNKDFNPNFVGAWWLGYVIGAAGFGTVAIAFMFFDYEMPETAALRLQKPVETHKFNFSLTDNTSGKPKVVVVLLKFVERIIKLFVNPVLVLVTIAIITHGLMADGIQPFFVKILRAQYVINEQKASLSIAVVIVIAIGLGSIVSGLSMRRANLGVRGLILVVLICVSTATLLGFGFLIRCPQEKISGITSNYDQFSYIEPIPKFDPRSLTATCNARCGCSPDIYHPVCYPKLGIQFYSPCFAGCRVQRSTIVQGRNITIYAGCDCLTSIFFQQQNLTLQQQAQFMAVLQTQTNVGPNMAMPKPANPAAAAQLNYLRMAYQNFSATNVVAGGTCDATCGDFYGEMVILYFILFIGYFIIIPLSNIIMRCVPEDEHSLALAFFQAMQRFLGSIPGPIMVGSILDRVCIFREANVCPGDEGSCNSYDTAELSRWLTGMFMGLHGVAITCYLLAFLLYKAPNGETLRQFCCDMRRKTSSQRPAQAQQVNNSEELDDEANVNPTFNEANGNDKL